MPDFELSEGGAGGRTTKYTKTRKEWREQCVSLTLRTNCFVCFAYFVVHPLSPLFQSSGAVPEL